MRDSATRTAAVLMALLVWGVMAWSLLVARGGPDPFFLSAVAAFLGVGGVAVELAFRKRRWKTFACLYVVPVLFNAVTLLLIPCIILCQS